MTDKLKIIFAGTPEFSAPSLQSLINDDAFTIVAVVTQPDKPSGRKQELIPSPVKKIALEHNLKIIQPENLKNNAALVEELKNLAPDFLAVVAYGQIIPKEILNLAKLGNINVHPSLLPKYRGASPIQSAIMNGDAETGITIMLMDEKMDHGPILTQEKIKLTGIETGEELHDILAEAGAYLLAKTIKNFAKGKIQPKEQSHSEATFCKIIAKDDGKINWQKPAEEIERQIRAFHSWPGSWTTWNGKRLKIFPPASIIKTLKHTSPGLVGPSPKNIKTIGQVALFENKVGIAVENGILIINQVQLEGKKETEIQEFNRGHNDFIGAILE